MWAICSSGWRHLWHPLRGSLMCSRWSLGGEQLFILHKLQSLKFPPVYIPHCGHRMWHVYVSRPLLQSLFALTSLLFSHVLLSRLPGWRSAAQRCPCSPGRSWCSLARSYGTVRYTSPALQSKTAALHTHCSSSSSSSLFAGEGTACCANVL